MSVFPTPILAAELGVRPDGAGTSTIGFAAKVGAAKRSTSSQPSPQRATSDETPAHLSWGRP